MSENYWHPASKVVLQRHFRQAEVPEQPNGVLLLPRWRKTLLGVYKRFTAGP